MPRDRRRLDAARAALEGRDRDSDRDRDHSTADPDEQPRWHMLVLEDCDEFMRNDAKAGSGQSLARLLNMTDGFLGQSSETLVCITTNENIAALHPAITRPGRCLSQIHVGPLSYAEAAAWLEGDAPAPPNGATLAQLFALRGDIAKVEHTEQSSSFGFYL
jgi:hypothetical protein